MQCLRDPKNGCPWDIEQDFKSILPYTLEEAYEVADAIERGDIKDLQEELLHHVEEGPEGRTRKATHGAAASIEGLGPESHDLDRIFAQGDAPRLDEAGGMSAAQQIASPVVEKWNGNQRAEPGHQAVGHQATQFRAFG